jgi:hypothetical protein
MLNAMALTNPLSIDMQYFIKSAYQDNFDLSDDLQLSRGFFTVPIIYLGPFEAFEDFDILKQAVLLIKETGFSVHLNTTAKFLSELADTQKKFFELREAGVDSITLRLNEEILNSLPVENVLNYYAACKILGINPLLEYFIDDKIPESFHDFLHKIEESTFYTNTSFRRSKKYKQSEFNNVNIQKLDLKKFFMVILDDGSVVIKTLQNRDPPLEIKIGSLCDAPLHKIIMQSLPLLQKKVII